MENLRDLLDLVLRWTHLVAGIMWIGNSLLWNWLDRNLDKEGRIWLLHSGGYYDVVKKQLRPEEFPKVLHWFKWQAYTTWLTGFSLLAVVYYSTGAAFMIDPEVKVLSVPQAHAIGGAAIFGGFIVYDLIWRSPLHKRPTLAKILCLLLLAGAVWGLTHTLAGRAAYIHVGALLGTCMAGNVFFHIMPSQRKLVAATKAGRPEDAKAQGAHAKERSIHNNYMTFPVLFLMVSNHFPMAYGSSLGWLILAVLMVGGAAVRHVMNVRFTFRAWKPALAGVMVATVGALYVLTTRGTSADAGAAASSGPAGGAHVSFTTVQLIVNERCKPCHSATPTDTSAPRPPIFFDSPEQIKAAAPRIQVRAVISKTMPLANKTAMTQDERDLLARWLIQGATIAD